RPDRGIFLILDHGSVVEGAQQISARVEFAQQPFVVDIETKRFGGRVEVGAINEERDLFGLCRHQLSSSLSGHQNRSSDPPAPGLRNAQAAWWTTVNSNGRTRQTLPNRQDRTVQGINRYKVGQAAPCSVANRRSRGAPR